MTEKARRERSDDANRGALRLIRLNKQDSSVGHSKALPEDPLISLQNDGRLIEPPFDQLSLSMLPEQNTELTPILDAMEENIDGFGWTIQPRLDLKKVEDPAERARLEEEMKTEKVRLINFFNYANIEDSFVELRKKLRRDLETTGNGYWEVIRNASGDIQGFEHIPSYQIRLSSVEPVPFHVSVPTLQLQTDGSFEIEHLPRWHRFRTFAQSRVTSGRGGSSSLFKMRWFKQFSDPRTYDNHTGEIVPAEMQIDMPEARKANELMHFKLYSGRSPYGLPRFIGQLLSIYGARAAENINYCTFQNNCVPSLAMLVSNGQLTEGTIERIESYVESQIQGSDNYSKFLIIEAEGQFEGEDSGHIKIDIKPLQDTQQKDAMFQAYMANNQENVRRAFRLPEILVGKTESINRSSAETSRRLADEQVFAPERMAFDDKINRLIFPSMGVKYHKFKSNSPNTTDNSELVQILAGAEKTGGISPRIARRILEDILGTDLPDFPEDERFDIDVPFSLSMAEAVKNMADPTEPGQQVTALKAIMGDDDE